jgi:nicotinate-nucleotide adenylyltransferase
MKRIGIYGGAFNPIHVGHLVLAETAREALGLNEVIFVPTGQPPHKSTRVLAPAEARLAMVRAAIRGNPAFRVARLEIDREGPSYTRDTLQWFKQHYKTAHLFLLVGQDNLRVAWRAWDEIVRLATVVVFTRPSETVLPRKQVRLLPMPLLQISSTDLRQRLRRGVSVRYQIPEAVLRVIDAYGLYR